MIEMCVGSLIILFPISCIMDQFSEFLMINLFLGYVIDLPTIWSSGVGGSIYIRLICKFNFPCKFLLSLINFLFFSPFLQRWSSSSSPFPPIYLALTTSTFPLFTLSVYPILGFVTFCFVLSFLRHRIPGIPTALGVAHPNPNHQNPPPINPFCILRRGGGGHATSPASASVVHTF